MTLGLLAAEILVYSLTLWLGLYLLARNPANLRLRWAGLGLTAYALRLAVDILLAYTPNSSLSLTLFPLAWPLLGLSGVCWLITLIYLWPDISTLFRGVFVAASLFFALALALLFFPPDWLPQAWILFAVGFDMFILGLVMAVLDALNEGEALVPDLFRSFDYAIATALLFGGLVVLAMLGGAGTTLPTVALLLATTTAAITIQTFADPIQTLVDRFAFAYFPWLRQARADLRAAASALPRVSPALDFESLDEAEFTRLTRRALSHFGDLPRLAASPLTYLPLIETRLFDRGAPDNTLERAAELKMLLSESIARLKPRDEGDFGTTEAWRHYNALYFPYVAGLKPYSRRSDYHNGFDTVTHEALEWFQTQVPERTLHNWQSAAARLVALDLRERLKREI